MKTADVPHASPSLLDRRLWLLGVSGMAVAAASTAHPSRNRSATAAGTTGSYPVTYHRTASVDGINIFYREAGPRTRRWCSSCTAFRPPPICSAT